MGQQDRRKGIHGEKKGDEEDITGKGQIGHPKAREGEIHPKGSKTIEEACQRR